jgi:uncharacterized protein YjiS (DUF1127 family)
MTTLVNYLPNLGNPFQILFKHIVSLRESYKYAREVAKTIQELNALTTKELNDIGISRGDIYSIAHGSADMKRRGL